MKLEKMLKLILTNNKTEFKEIKEDKTKTEDKMPNTGVCNVVGLMSIVAVFGAVCLVRYNKYKEI